MSWNLTRSALLVFSLLVLAIVDSCQGIIESSGVIRVVRGQSAPINGRLDSALPDLERLHGVSNDPQDLETHLTYESDSSSIHVVFLELSGRMWRGRIVADKDVQPDAKYTVVVHQKGVAVDQGTPKFEIRVFRTSEELQADSATFSERLIGIRPLWLVVVLLPLGLLMLYLIYKENDRQEKKLQSMGLGGIYKLARRKDRWEVVFGLGYDHGIHPQDELYILDQAMQVKGILQALTVGDDTSTAEVPLSGDIKPEYYISLHPPQFFQNTG